MNTGSFYASASWLRLRGTWLRAVCLALCLCAAVPAFAQVRPVWTNRYDNALSSKTNTPLGLALDPSGNVLVAGSSVNTNDNWDYVVIKYAANGTPLWTNRYDSGSNDLARGFVVDREGNTLLTGTSQTVKVGNTGAHMWAAPYGGRGVAVDTNGNVLVTGFSEVDFATAKIHGATGTNLWTRFYDKIGKQDVSHAVTADNEGNVYVAGVELWFFVPPTFPNNELAVVKYDPNGQQVWVLQPYFPGYNGDRGTEIRGLTVDRSRGLLYLAANVRWGLNGVLFLTAQMTLSGQTNWVTYQVPASGPTVGVSAIALTSRGSVFLTGGWDYPMGNCAAYTTYKLNPDSSTNESPVWKSQYGPVPIPGYHRANAIAVDSADNAYIAGISTGTDTGYDFATLSYDPGGNQRWVQRWSSAGSATDEATGIAVDAGGNVYVTGYATNPQGGTEIVTIKYAPNPPPPVQIQPNGAIRLQLPRDPGQPYRVEITTNLSVLQWQNLGLATSDVTGLLTFDDTNTVADSPARFYHTVTP